MELSLLAVIGSSAAASRLLNAADAIGPLISDQTASATSMLREYIVTTKFSGSPLHSRSGKLRDSIVAAAESGTGEARGTISTAVPYARIQEFGGEITAHRASNLTIPLAAALDAEGLARFTAKQLIATPALGGFKSTLVRKQILFGVGIGRTITPLFKLQHSVQLPARSFFGSALAEKRLEILALYQSSLVELL